MVVHSSRWRILKGVGVLGVRGSKHYTGCRSMRLGLKQCCVGFFLQQVWSYIVYIYILNDGRKGGSSSGARMVYFWTSPAHIQHHCTKDASICGLACVAIPQLLPRWSCKHGPDVCTWYAICASWQDYVDFPNQQPYAFQSTQHNRNRQSAKEQRPSNIH